MSFILPSQQRILFLLFCALLLPAAPVLSNDASVTTMYIKPIGKIPVRRGQGTKYKIVAMVGKGSAVQLLEKTEDYAKIRLQSGKEGWILARFLDKNVPVEQILEKIQAENSNLKKQIKETVKKEAEATASLEESQQQLKNVLLERNTLLENYQQLQKDTADVVQLKRNQQETAQLNKKLEEQVITLKDENTLLKKEKKLDWFITGAIVLAIGMLLGKIPPPRRKKRYLSIG